MTSVIPDSPSPQLQAVLKCIDGFNKWDPDLIIADTSDDWKHHTLPRSLGIPVRNKEEWKSYFNAAIHWFMGFTVCRLRFALQGNH